MNVGWTKQRSRRGRHPAAAQTPRKHPRDLASAEQYRDASLPAIHARELNVGRLVASLSSF
ncbi:MAG: hypothetical protein K9M02_02775 [Thiohalocapsa sp.]|nr:hypothetical protein [Thiohalocapsa sp.]